MYVWQSWNADWQHSMHAFHPLQRCSSGTCDVHMRSSPKMETTRRPTGRRSYQVWTAAPPMVRAYDLRNILILSLSRTTPSSVSISLEQTASTYDLATISAALSLILRPIHTSGHPPLQQKKASLPISIGLEPWTSSLPPEKSEARLTEPLESPDSRSENGCILRCEMRLVPLCLLESFFLNIGVDDHVRMK